MRRAALPLALVAAASLTACVSRPPIPKEASATETFRLEEDLVGKKRARGEFRPRFGGEPRGLTAILDGTWDGRTLTLVEDFFYDDGEVDQKTWVLTKVGDGEWTGTREDVVGKARGYEDGPAFRLEYLAEVPVGDGVRRVRFRDVIVERDDGVILNRATVGYYGLQVGSVELLIGVDAPTMSLQN